MNTQARSLAIIALSLLAGCGGAGSALTGPPATDKTRSFTAAANVQTLGHFTEYALPAGVNPSDLTRGPYDTVYFTNTGNRGGPANLYEMVAGTGHIHVFTAPSPYVSSGFDAITSYNRSVTFVVLIPINEDEFFLAHVTPEGKFSFDSAAYLEYGALTNLAVGFDGNPWYGYCVDPCQGPDNGVIVPPDTSLGDSFYGTAITPGPGGNMYVTANYYGPPPPPTTDSRVYVISTAGAILNKIDLPLGSFPQSIVTGSDGNLWITEPGINKIARMTPSGTVTQFTIPTANAGPHHITYGYDLAQFFTEENANKIGRITTSGRITEYAIPTANSGATGITPCGSAICGKHGGVWFTETTANKIGRFNAPN